VAAAVIKFDTLADAIWPAAQDHDFLSITGPRFTFHFAHHRGLIGGVHVRCLGLKFGSTGVDAFERGCDPKVVTRAAHLALIAPCEGREAGVREAEHLERAKAGFVHRQAVLFDCVFGVDDFAEPIKEPRVKGRDLLDFIV